jgi:hypothetical protein
MHLSTNLKESWCPSRQRLGRDKREGRTMECDVWPAIGSVLNGENVSIEGILIREADFRNVDR